MSNKNTGNKEPLPKQVEEELGQHLPKVKLADREELKEFNASSPASSQEAGKSTSLLNDDCPLGTSIQKIPSSRPNYRSIVEKHFAKSNSKFLFPKKEDER